MVSLGTQPAIERAGLVTPRLPVRAPKIYPDIRTHGLNGGPTCNHATLRHGLG